MRLQLNNQWEFFIQRASGIPLFKKAIITFAATLISYSFLIIFSSSDRFVGLKSIFTVMLAFAALAVLIISLVTLIQYTKYKQFINNYLKSIQPEQLTYHVELNDDKIKIISDDRVYEYLWSDFDSYGINKETIYVLNAAKAIESLYWSREEMGNENFSFLVELLNKNSIDRVF